MLLCNFRVQIGHLFDALSVFEDFHKGKNDTNIEVSSF